MLLERHFHVIVLKHLRLLALRAAENRLGFELSVNGKLRQKGDTSNMIFDVPSQLRFINSLVPLLRGATKRGDEDLLDAAAALTGRLCLGAGR